MYCKIACPNLHYFDNGVSITRHRHNNNMCKRSKNIGQIKTKQNKFRLLCLAFKTT
jgi:hypothetical protein